MTEPIVRSEPAAGEAEPSADPATPPQLFAELARCYRATVEHVDGPGVVVGARDGLTFGAIGFDIPDLNRVMSMTSDEQPSNALIDEVLALLVSYQGLSWWIPPGRGRGELEARLGARGLAASREESGAPAMWLPPEAEVRVPDLPDVTIETVSTGDEAYEATLVMAEGFGMDADLGRPMAEVFRLLGERPAGPARFHVARLAGRPVATAMDTVEGHAATIYCVATIPEARGRGIGGAVTAAAVVDARSRGARVVSLETSTMGRPVYRRLGFREGGELRILVRRRD